MQLQLKWADWFHMITGSDRCDSYRRLASLTTARLHMMAPIATIIFYIYIFSFSRRSFPQERS